MPKILKICLIITVITLFFSFTGTVINYFKERQMSKLGIDYEQINYSLPESTTTTEIPLSPDLEDFSKQIDYHDLLNPIERINEILRERGLPVYEPGKTGNGSYKDFVSPDGRLKLQYPGSWMTAPQDKLDEMSAKQSGFNSQTLFLAYSPDIGNISQAIVSEQNYEEAKSLEKIMEDMQKSNQEQGWDMKILDKNQVDEGDLIFQAEYKKDERYSLRSKERIISLGTDLGEQRIYTVAFISLDKYWDEVQEKADSVIDSVEIGTAAGFNGD